MTFSLGLTLFTALVLLVVLVKDQRQIVIFCFGIASGFPWVLIGSAMTAWLVDAGLSRGAVGYFGSIFAVYAINFLWAPLLDKVRLPLLGRLGKRRGWILFCQIILFAATATIGLTDPSSSLMWTSIVALTIAVVSATQDVAIDGYRIEHIPREDTEGLSRAAAMATIGWWTGYALIGAVPFFIVGKQGMDWGTTYLLLAAVWIPLMLVVLWAKDSSNDPAVQPSSEALNVYQGGWHAVWQANAAAANATAAALAVMLSLILWLLISAGVITQFALTIGGASLLFAVVHLSYGAKLPAQDRWQPGLWFAHAVFEPLRDFFARNGIKIALSVLLFVFLFKIGEAFLGRMSVVFYKEIGFSNEEIGYYSKMIGWAATVLFSIIGSQINRIYGVFRGLLIGGMAMAASNLMFAWIAQVGADTHLLAAAVVIDGFTGAVATVAFVSFISWMTSRAYGATQYALLASLGNLGRTTLAAFSGALVTQLDSNWSLFFILTALMVIPGLLLLLVVRKQLGGLGESPR